MKKHLPKVVLFFVSTAVCGLLLLIFTKDKEVEPESATPVSQQVSEAEPTLATIPVDSTPLVQPTTVTDPAQVDEQQVPQPEAPFEKWDEGLKYYTVQVGSFKVRDNVDKEFTRIAGSLSDGDLKHLRIEKVQDYYTIRIGMLTSISRADILWRNILNDYPESRLIHAYVKQERIVTMNDPSDFRKMALPAKPSVGTELTESIEPVKLPPKVDESLPVLTPAPAPVAPVSTKAKALGPGEFYTIQLASLPDIGGADQEMSRFGKLLPNSALDYLRIEKVSGYFTVRTGRFQSLVEAEEIRQQLMARSPSAALIASPNKPERVFAVYGAQAVLGVGSKKEKTAPVVSAPKVVKKVEPPIVESIAPVPGPILEEEILAPAPVEEVVDIPHEAVDIKLEKEASPVKPEEQGTVIEEVAKQKEADKDKEPAEFGMKTEVVAIIKTDDQGSQMGRPSTLFFDANSSELYILNGRSNRLVTFGPDYFPTSSAGKGRGLSYIRGGMGAKDGIYVCHGDESGMYPRLSKMNAAFLPIWVKKLEEIPGAGNFLPYRLAMGSERLYIIGLNSSKTMVMDRDGNFLHWMRIDPEKVGSKQKFTKEDSEPGVSVSDVSIDSLGNILFLSEGDGKVYVFNNKEEYLFKFGKKGGSRGKLSRGRGLAVDEKKKCIYVVDYLRHTVIVYDFAGKQRFEFGGRGWGEGWFNFPTDIEVGYDGHVIVCDFFNDRVQVFRTSTKEAMPDRPDKLWKTNQGANG